MKKSNLVAGVLARVSTEEQVLSESIDVHIDRCVEHCKRQNWPVKKVYKLPGVSGKSVMGHREIQKMPADVRPVFRVDLSQPWGVGAFALFGFSGQAVEITQ